MKSFDWLFGRTYLDWNEYQKRLAAYENEELESERNDLNVSK